MEVTSEHKNILRVGENEIRVRIHGRRVEDCERILGALQKGKFTVKEGVSLENLDQIDFHQPYSFLPAEESEQLRVTFGDTSDHLVTYTLTINDKDDGITISGFDRRAL